MPVCFLGNYIMLMDSAQVQQLMREQVDQPGRLARRQVQAVIDAIRADGKYIPLSSRLPDPPAKPSATRYVSDSRSL